LKPPPVVASFGKEEMGLAFGKVKDVKAEKAGGSYYDTNPLTMHHVSGKSLKITMGFAAFC